MEKRVQMTNDDVKNMSNQQSLKTSDLQCVIVWY